MGPRALSLRGLGVIAGLLLPYSTAAQQVDTTCSVAFTHHLHGRTASVDWFWGPASGHFELGADTILKMPVPCDPYGVLPPVVLRIDFDGELYGVRMLGVPKEEDSATLLEIGRPHQISE